MHSEKAERLAISSLSNLESSILYSKARAHRLLNYIEHKLMVNFDKELSELSEPVWDKNYRQ